mgnify:CR=1 FL=1|tara:strand:+ start:460 stop:669 length:210 start_codon:yes stop_codon:yes gene_type:complete
MIKEKLEDWEKEICEEIRNIEPLYKDKDDVWIYNYCGAVWLIEELICNKGYSIKSAVKKIFKRNKSRSN